jgi:hypothetical protein
MGESWIAKIRRKIKGSFGKKDFLCDTCKWDWRAACHNPDRPNATSCKDYQKRGS